MSEENRLRRIKGGMDIHGVLKRVVYIYVPYDSIRKKDIEHYVSLCGFLQTIGSYLHFGRMEIKLQGKLAKQRKLPFQSWNRVLRTALGLLGDVKGVLEKNE